VSRGSAKSLITGTVQSETIEFGCWFPRIARRREKHNENRNMSSENFFGARHYRMEKLWKCLYEIRPVNRKQMMKITIK